jgi:hypothetical protein
MAAPKEGTHHVLYMPEEPRWSDFFRHVYGFDTGFRAGVSGKKTGAINAPDEVCCSSVYLLPHPAVH